MRQRGNGSGLALEPVAELWIRRERVGDDLDGDRCDESRVVRRLRASFL
jgi:hypothetical protein